MDNEFLLPLRQRQLLSYLQHATGYTTGSELSKNLGVSTRTIRNDISEINRILNGTGVQISSKHSFGYIIETRNTNDLKKLTQSSESFISRIERLRHIALRLCLSEVPIDLDDLADEMYISKTTLEHDLKDFRHDFILPVPHIQMCRSKNSIVLENNELKKRQILCRLYSENWNYNGRGNTFFKYQYLDEEEVNLCMREIDTFLFQYNIRIEDPNVVVLDLVISIAAKRIREGHGLKEDRKDLYITDQASACVDAILDSLEKRLHVTYTRTERREIYEIVSCSAIPDISKVSRDNANQYFPQKLIVFVNSWLRFVDETFNLMLLDDRDFYSSFLLYIRYLTMPVHHLTASGIVRNLIQLQYAIEFEIAVTIQPYALDFFGSYLDFNEIMYLMLLISGGLAHQHPNRLRTVIMTHFNLPAAFNIKAKLEENFSNFIKVTAMLPMYLKDDYDFTSTDLILSTTDKDIQTALHTPLIKISPFFTEDDHRRLEHHIQKVRYQHLYQKDFPHMLSILDQASWNELWTDSDYFHVLERLGNLFIDKGFANEQFLEGIFRQERLISFVTHPTFIIVHAHQGSLKTHVEVATLNHRLRINGQKIRMIIMVSMVRADRGLIFKFFNELYNGSFDPEDMRFLKTKVEVMNFFKKYLDQ